VQQFAYSDTSFPIRADIAEANRDTWRRIARPGAWWTGAERIAIAAETRNARTCGLCAERKQALSPNAVDGRHDGDHGVLPEAAVDAVHRIVTDQSRLSEAYVADLEAAGISDGHYVELLGVLVAVVSIDSFHRAMGLPPEPLPEPEPGDASQYRPVGLRSGEAWVPMLGPSRSKIGPSEKDLFAGLPIVPNVLRAMSLVPDAVRMLKDQSRAYYLEMLDVADPSAEGNRAITREQIELVAGRVSALNECFY
jgi:hypothetical protein